MKDTATIGVPAVSRASGGDVGAVAVTLLVVVSLAALNVAEHFLPSANLWLGPVAAIGLLWFARATGLSWTQLGLGADRIRHGAVWGGGVIAVIAAVYAVGVAVPATRGAFLDSRYHFGLSRALLSAFVVIPVGTVLVEEVAFRSVLWGALGRHSRQWTVLAVSSALFGLWHVLPSLGFAGATHGAAGSGHLGASTTVLVVCGTVVFTGLGGLVAGELRRRSGSVLASAGMHWATNSLGVLFGLVAWRLAA